MPMTQVNNDHEQLVAMVNQLLEEREMLSRENEYFKAKLNESVLTETIQEMKKERDLLFKLLSNLTMNNNKDQQLRLLKHQIKENNTNLLSSPSYSTFNGKSVDSNNSLIKQNASLLRHPPSSTMNHARVHRLKTNIGQQPTIVYRTENADGSSSSSTTHIKHPQTNKKILVYKTSVAPETQEFNKPIRKHEIQLKHSQNSPFQHYRSQSLQDLT